MKDVLADLREFHTAFEQPIIETPQLPGADRVALRMALLDEEHREFRAACQAQDLIGAADALADIIYVAVGTALEFGIPLDRVWAEVHRSNMAKVDPATGKVRRRDDGKILKPEGWTPPDIAGAMAAEPAKPVPRRAHEFICKVGADTKEGLVDRVYELARDLKREEITAGVSGGYSSGAIYAYRHDGSVTHDSYFAELEALLPPK